jgi:hypothetical protein
LGVDDASLSKTASGKLILQSTCPCPKCGRRAMLLKYCDAVMCRQIGKHKGCKTLYCIRCGANLSTPGSKAAHLSYGGKCKRY